jgi:iron complex transport system substrate-binding protein
MRFRSPAAMLFALLAGTVTAFAALAAAAQAAPFIDAAGRRVILPDQIGRILPAERNAEVLVFVLAPDKLAGLEGISGRALRLPRGAAVFRWRPRSTPASMAATAQRVGADLIIDAGPVTPEGAAYADQVQQLSGIPYILIDDSFARIPRVLRAIGGILEVAERSEDLGIFAEHAIAGLRGRLLIRPANARPHVYYGLGPDGLATPLPGSPAGAAIEEAGAINVAGKLGRGGPVRVSREQLLAWDPEIIIAERRSFYDALRRSPGWHRLSAVRNKRVYLEPSDPFGWIENPSGVNRLVGLYWMSSLFYPDATQEDLRATVCDFYDKFYRTKLTNRALEALVGPAGAPPSDSARPQAEPLVGLGAAPTSSLPPGTPGAPGGMPMPPISTGGAATATCSVPTGPSPKPLPGITTAPGIPLDTPSGRVPGVPPPGPRGQPATGLPR